MEPKVSILLITYNQVNYIADAIASAVEQDYENLEVVVADDGSVDGTKDIVLGFAKRYPKRVIPVLGERNLGITGNCNRGLAFCNGKYTAHQGGDDILLPGKITKQVSWFEQNDKRVLCGHDVEVFFDDRKKKTVLRRHGRAGRSGTGNVQLYEYGVDSFFMGTSMMWRTDAVPNRGFDERLTIVADWKFIVDVVGQHGEWGSVPGVFAKYRKHEANISNISRFYRLHRDCIQTVRFSRIEQGFNEESYQKARLATYYNLVVQLWMKGNYSRARRCYKAMWKRRQYFHPYIYKWMFRLFQPNWLANFEIWGRRMVKQKLRL